MKSSASVVASAGYIDPHMVRLLQSRKLNPVVLADLSSSLADAVSGAELLIGDAGGSQFRTRCSRSGATMQPYTWLRLSNWLVKNVLADYESTCGIRHDCLRCFKAAGRVVVQPVRHCRVALRRRACCACSLCAAGPGSAGLAPCLWAAGITLDNSSDLGDLTVGMQNGRIEIIDCGPLLQRGRGRA